MPSYCCSSSDFLQSHYTVLLSTSFAFFMHLLKLLFTSLYFFRSFRFKSFLSQLSPLVAQIKNFCSDPGFFLLTMFARDLTGCFNHCSVEGGDDLIQVCVFIVHDGERCNLPAYYSLEDFQHIGIFQLFEVKLESCVFWLTDSFQAKVKNHQQVVVTSNVCFWKTLCSCNVKRVGESRHPCRTPTVVLNQSLTLPLKRTALVALSYIFFYD